MALGLMPLRHCDLRATLHWQATCSDASESGGGVCTSIGLTHMGRRAALEELQFPLRESESPVLPSPFGVTYRGIVIFEFFGGIGGFRRALERIHIPIKGAVLCEIDEAARRAALASWPSSIVWQDITQVSASMLVEFLSSFLCLEGVASAGGSPCQGISGLSSKRQHFLSLIHI